MFTAGQGATQWMLTKAFDGEGKHLWENPPESEFAIQLPKWWRDEKGRKQQIKPLKQAREVVRYFTNPMEIIGSKTSPLVRNVIEQASGHSPGSNFRRPFADMEFWDGLPLRIKDLVTQVAPLSLRGNSFAFVLPKSTSMNNFKTTKLFYHNLRGWAEQDFGIFSEGRRASDADVLSNPENIAKHANENNLDTQMLFSGALSRLKTEYYGEFFAALNEGDQKAAEKWAKAITRIGGTDKSVDASLRRRYERALRENSLQIQEAEARARLERAKRKIQSASGGEIDITDNPALEDLLKENINRLQNRRSGRATRKARPQRKQRATR